MANFKGLGTLLSNPLFMAGAGILANNRGNYGRFGPAMMGGLQGLAIAGQQQQLLKKQADEALKQQQMEAFNRQATMGVLDTMNDSPQKRALLAAGYNNQLTPQLALQYTQPPPVPAPYSNWLAQQENPAYGAAVRAQDAQKQALEQQKLQVQQQPRMFAPVVGEGGEYYFPTSAGEMKPSGIKQGQKSISLNEATNAYDAMYPKDMTGRRVPGSPAFDVFFQQLPSMLSNAGTLSDFQKRFPAQSGGDVIESGGKKYRITKRSPDGNHEIELVR